jgi:tRNA(Ile)-lysidine synthase
MPELQARFPGYRTALARSAALCAEASILLDELALADGMHALSDGTLDVGILQRLSPPRARNLLRWFLRTQGASQAPSAKRLGEALRQLVNARDDARLRIAVGDTELRRHLGRVHAVKVKVCAAEPLSWHGEPVLPAPCGSGVVYFRPTEGSGIALARLSGRSVDLRVRAGGERLRPDCARPRRTLKNLLREARIAPWLRSGMPLLYCDGQLVWVPPIGIECGWQAQPGELGVMPDWRRSDPCSGVAGDRSLQSCGNKLSKQD